MPSNAGEQPFEPIGEREANRVAGRFLRSAWNDDSIPAVKLAKDAYGAAVWRSITRQERPDRPSGTLTLDVDARPGRPVRRPVSAR